MGLVYRANLFPADYIDYGQFRVEIQLTGWRGFFKLCQHGNVTAGSLSASLGIGSTSLLTEF